MNPPLNTIHQIYPQLHSTMVSQQKNPPSLQPSKNQWKPWNQQAKERKRLKGMIEGGAKKGLKESFNQFAGLLGQRVKFVNQLIVLDKDQMLEALLNDHQSHWELRVWYFCNFTVFSTVFMVVYAFVHIFLCDSNRIQGLEFNGLEFPDSFGEFVMCGVIFFNLERVYIMVSRFVQARLSRVALIKGNKLPPLDCSGFLDPFVVLTCNGKTRTSSFKLQTLDPQLNEILEFDVAEEPLLLLNVEVFGFDGPFGQPTSLGHAEIRFLRHTSEELFPFFCVFSFCKQDHGSTEFFDPLRGLSTETLEPVENTVVAEKLPATQPTSHLSSKKEWTSFNKLLMQRFPVPKMISVSSFSSKTIKGSKASGELSSNIQSDELNDSQKLKEGGFKIVSQQEYIKWMHGLKHEIMRS
ncbi:unnamed protein product [Lactuca saligna]|uniref:C2 domain-containing protein n=1 Tax=Lactuca saligna TaxID=75948 RepID=A0AA35YPF0_LACSI|nr:unnamed protein product [Lactuca saligna]